MPGPAARRRRLLGLASAAAVLVTLGMLPAGPALGSADLIDNGSFESPDIASGSFAIFPSIPGWSYAPRPGTTSSGMELHDRLGAPATGAGDQWLEIDSTGPTRVSQHISTTPGGAYRLTLLWSPRPNTAAAQNTFLVYAGSATATVGPVAGGTATSWRTFSLDFVAEESSTEVAFLDLGPEEGNNQGLGALIDDVSVVPLDPNNAPDCSAVAADASSLSPPDHTMRLVTLAGAVDPDGDDITLDMTGVTQDEPVDARGDGRAAPDAAAGATSSAVQLRAERAGSGDGRVYTVAYLVTDEHGATCAGTAVVGVPHDRHGDPLDSGGAYDSFAGGG